MQSVSPWDRPPAAQLFPLTWRVLPGRGYAQHALPEGVALTAGGIAWGAALDHSGTLGEIDQLVLRPFTTDDDGVRSAQCEITFRDRRRLIVFSLGARGASRDATYASFVRALHGRLGQGDRARIVFRNGATSAHFWTTAFLAPFGIVMAALLLVKPLGWAPPQAILAVLPLVVGFLVILLRYAHPRRWYYRPEALPAHALPPEGTEGKSQA